MKADFGLSNHASMKKNKLDRYEVKKQSEITPEEHRANCEILSELLLSVAEKVEKLPSVPVAEKFDELILELKNGVKRQPTIIQTHDGRRVRVMNSGEIIENEKPKMDGEKSTKPKSGGSKDSSINTETFSETELQILKQFDA